MRDPGSMHDIYEYASENPPAIIKIDSVPEYNIEDFDLNDEKEFKKFIQSVERDVRGSYEYKQFTAYLRENLDMNKCSFYMNVNNVDSTKIRIEIHHEPLSLYDICLIVCNKRNYFHESLEEELVAKEVMCLHYKLWVGLIPLAETVHELVHNQYLFVPTSKVMGNYREFINQYQQWMLPEQIDILDHIEHTTRDYESEYKTILSKQFIYVDLSGAYDLPRKEDLIKLMKERIGEIIPDKDKQTKKLIAQEEVAHATANLVRTPIEPIKFFN